MTFKTQPDILEIPLSSTEKKYLPLKVVWPSPSHLLSEGVWTTFSLVNRKLSPATYILKKQTNRISAISKLLQEYACCLEKKQEQISITLLCRAASTSHAQSQASAHTYSHTHSHRPAHTHSQSQCSTYAQS